MASKTFNEVATTIAKVKARASDNIPPHDMEAERALLGSILLSPNILDDIISMGMRSDEFYRPAHRRIFKAMCDMSRHGFEADAVTLKGWLEKCGDFDSVGGYAYLIELQGATSSSSRWKQYAAIIKEKCKYRGIVAIGSKLVADGFSGEPGDSERLIGEALAEVSTLALDGERDIKTADDVGNEFMRKLESGEANYISPRGVDIARIEAGDLAVVAAGTSVGKTAMSMDWANDWSKYTNVAYFEYEMTEASLFARLVCKEAGVTMTDIQDQSLSMDELSRVKDAVADLKTRSLYIEEVWCDVGILMSKIRRVVKQHNVEVVMIDHLGLIPFGRGQGMNEAKAIGVYVTNPLKRLAAELGIKIVLLVQLNREGQKDGGFPRLHHLRDSGEIEQDASIVLTLWSERAIRDDWSKRMTIREKSGMVTGDELHDDSFYLFRIGVEKNRNNPLGEVWSIYRGEHFRFDFREQPKEICQRELI